MRLSVLHLLLGAALAAPIQDVEQTHHRREVDNLVARGLVPVHAHSPVFIPPKPVVVPKPIAPKPVTPKPKPVEPVPPGGVKPPTGPNAPVGPEPPAPLHPLDPAPPPADTPPQPGKPVDDPTKPPANNPVEPGKPVDDPTKPPSSKPGDPNTVVRPNDGPEVPTVQSCRLKRCVDDGQPMSDADLTKVKDGGAGVTKKLDDSITAKNADTGKATGVFNDYPGYKSQDGVSSHKLEDPYLKDEKWKDAFQAADFSEYKIRSGQPQRDQLNKWVDGDKDGDLGTQLKKQGADDTEIQMAQNAERNFEGDDKVMLRALTNPGKGSVVVKGSFKDRDLYNGNEEGKTPKLWSEEGGEFTYERPPFGDAKEKLFWSDQVMTTWRQSVRKNPGTKVEDLKYMAQDDMITLETQKVVDRVMGD